MTPDVEQRLSDALARIQALEAKREQPQRVSNDFTKPIVYFDEEVELKAASISSNLDWTNSTSDKHLPESATEAILWCGIRDTTQGVGTSKMEARADNKIVTIGEIYEPGSGDAMTTLSQVRVPVDQGRFDYRVTLAGGATALYYIIRLVGYIE